MAAHGDHGHENVMIQNGDIQNGMSQNDDIQNVPKRFVGRCVYDTEIDNNTYPNVKVLFMYKQNDNLFLVRI